MTAYGPPRQNDSQEPPEWVKSKAAKKKQLAEVRARRAEIYRRYREKMKRQAGQA
jgi:hypothetical protein